MRSSRLVSSRYSLVGSYEVMMETQREGEIFCCTFLFRHFECVMIL